MEGGVGEVSMRGSEARVRDVVKKGGSELSKDERVLYSVSASLYDGF